MVLIVARVAVAGLIGGGKPQVCGHGLDLRPTTEHRLNAQKITSGEDYWKGATEWEGLVRQDPGEVRRKATGMAYLCLKKRRTKLWKQK